MGIQTCIHTHVAYAHNWMRCDAMRLNVINVGVERLHIYNKSSFLKIHPSENHIIKTFNQYEMNNDSK